MSITNENHALQSVRKQLRKKKNAIGSEDLPFLSAFFSQLGGCKPTRDEVNFVRGGVEAGESRGEFYVVRNNLGEIVTVDIFDCSKIESDDEPEPPAKQVIGNYELLPVLCDLLEKRCNADRVIITGRTMPKLIDELYQELSLVYDTSHTQVRQVFDAMHLLDLRGDSAKLRRQGMEFTGCKELPANTMHVQQDLERANATVVAQNEQIAARNAHIERLEAAERALKARLKLLSEENRGLLAENATLTAENTTLSEDCGRLTQANDDLRMRNARLADLERAVRGAVTQYDENP